MPAVWLNKRLSVTVVRRAGRGGRKPGYDSDADSIVRVEFNRLRKKRKQFYGSEAAHDKWQIAFPQGNYAPEFVRGDQTCEPRS
jgi:hypothetical protein